ncbi:MAG: response regulator, partial [Bacteroidota bacterium]
MGKDLEAIVIDDEQSSHKILRELLEDSKLDVKIVGNAYSVSEGIEQIKQKSPNLLFLDIELPDGLGFDLLEVFPDPDFRVIFITAHNKYALSAIRFEAFEDYLEKPISLTSLKEGLRKVRVFRDRIMTIEKLSRIKENYENAERKK